MLKRWLSKTIDHLLQLMGIRCKDISSIISKMIDHAISPTRYWRIKIHLGMCSFCRYYESQLRVLTLLTKELAKANQNKIDNASIFEVLNINQKSIKPQS